MSLPVHPATSPLRLDIEQIMARIPHRYPFLLLDAVEEIVPGERGIGIKNVTINEPFFPGHFPGKPIMPGVLIVEAMAQTAAVLVVEGLYGDKAHTDLVYFMSVEKARFRRPVRPGDRLELHCHKERQRGDVWRFVAKAYVGQHLCAEATYTAMLARQSEAA